MGLTCDCGRSLWTLRLKYLPHGDIEATCPSCGKVTLWGCRIVPQSEEFATIRKIANRVLREGI